MDYIIYISPPVKDLTNPLYEQFKAHFIDCMINPSCLKLHDKIAEGSHIQCYPALFTLMYCLHIGAFGKVYKGIYIKGDEEETEVAIKVLKGNLQQCILYVITLYNYNSIFTYTSRRVYERVYFY